MGRPVVTAILLEDLRRQGEEIRLRKDSLVTPAARDWMREHPLPITWLEAGGDGAGGSLAAVMDPSLPELRMVRTMLDRQGVLADVIEPGKGRKAVADAVQRLCERIAGKHVAKGVVFVQDGAVPVCLANKHVGIRAALGMNLPMVEEACRELGINVLVIEYPAQTAYQMKQMIDRLARGPAAPQPENLAAIEKIEQGGTRADR